MSLEGSEVREDIYEFYEFEERRKSMIRNSNSSRSICLFMQWKVEIKARWILRRAAVSGGPARIGASTMTVSVKVVVSSIIAPAIVNQINCVSWGVVA